MYLEDDSPQDKSCGLLEDLADEPQRRGARTAKTRGRHDLDHDGLPGQAQVEAEVAGAGRQVGGDVGVIGQQVAQQGLQHSLAGHPGAQQHGFLEQDLRLSLDDQSEPAGLGRGAGDPDRPDRGAVVHDRQRHPGAHADEPTRLLGRVRGGTLRLHHLDRRLVEGADAGLVSAADHDAGGVGDDDVETDDGAGVACDLLGERGRQDCRPCGGGHGH